MVLILYFTTPRGIKDIASVVIASTMIYYLIFQGQYQATNTYLDKSSFRGINGPQIQVLERF